MARSNGEKPLELKKEIFLSHGKDIKPLSELKEMLVAWGLKPVVLSEQPSGGKTVIEKLEAYSDVGFVFVILTPDDLGGFVELGSKWSRPQRLRKFLKTAHKSRLRLLGPGAGQHRAPAAGYGARRDYREVFVRPRRLDPGV